MDYIDQYGWHFNKKMCDFAVSLMKKKTPSSTKAEKIDPWTKEQVEDFLKRNNVTLENNKLYDAVFVTNKARAIHYGNSIKDEAHLALHVKDCIDDINSCDETTFRAWLATLVGNDQYVEWNDML